MSGRRKIIPKTESPNHHLDHEGRSAENPSPSPTVHRGKLLHGRSLLWISGPKRDHRRLGRQCLRRAPRLAILRRGHRRHLVRLDGYGLVGDLDVHCAVSADFAGSKTRILKIAHWDLTSWLGPLPRCRRLISEDSRVTAYNRGVGTVIRLLCPNSGRP